MAQESSAKKDTNERALQAVVGPFLTFFCIEPVPNTARFGPIVLFSRRSSSTTVCESGEICFRAMNAGREWVNAASDGIGLNFRGRMQNSIIRVLVVDDYEKWRSFARATIEKQDGLEVIGEISDGLQVLQHAQRLQPELIILDIGIPTINGIEVARRIRESTSKAKILFLTENRSPEIAEKALSTGANGYVVKSDAGRELLPAIKAVLEGKRFISKSLAAHFLVTSSLSIAQISLLISWFG